jgi:hypothetical protein
MLSSSESATSFGIGDKPEVDFSLKWTYFVAVLIEALDISGEMRVSVELRCQHRGRRSDVGQSRVGILQLPPKVEAHSSPQVPRFLSMEDYLDIDQPSILRFKGDPCSPKFGDEHRKVETPKVEAGEIARIEKFEEAPRPSEEGRLASDIGIRDPVDGGRLLRDRYLRVEAAHALQYIAMRREPDEGKFDNSVCTDSKPGCLKVEKDERTREWKGESGHGSMGSGREHWRAALSDPAKVRSAPSAAIPVQYGAMT